MAQQPPQPRSLALPKARALFENAKRTRLLHLSSLSLRAVPSEAWALGAALVRLDLSFNNLTFLPGESLAALTSLEQLWLNDNPALQELPLQVE